MTYNKHTQAKLREYHTARMTVAEIAEKLHLPKDFVRRELNEMGYRPIEAREQPESEFLKGRKLVNVSKKSVKVTPELERRLCELRDKKFSTRQIADKLGISQPTVCRTLKRLGYTGKNLDKRNKTKEDITGNTETKEDKPMKPQINKDFDAAVNQMIAEAKEKEPAPAATGTSSEQEIVPVIPTTNNTTETPKSQALSAITIPTNKSIEAVQDESNA